MRMRTMMRTRSGPMRSKLKDSGPAKCIRIDQPRARTKMNKAEPPNNNERLTNRTQPEPNLLCLTTRRCPVWFGAGPATRVRPKLVRGTQAQSNELGLISTDLNPFPNETRPKFTQGSLEELDISPHIASDAYENSKTTTPGQPTQSAMPITSRTPLTSCRLPRRPRRDREQHQDFPRRRRCRSPSRT